MNWIPIGLNWTILFKCLEMTIVVIWRYINKTELNWICTVMFGFAVPTAWRKCAPSNLHPVRFGCTPSGLKRSLQFQKILKLSMNLIPWGCMHLTTMCSGQEVCWKVQFHSRNWAWHGDTVCPIVTQSLQQQRKVFLQDLRASLPSSFLFGSAILMTQHFLAQERGNVALLSWSDLVWRCVLSLRLGEQVSQVTWAESGVCLLAHLLCIKHHQEPFLRSSRSTSLRQIVLPSLW